MSTPASEPSVAPPVRPSDPYSPGPPAPTRPTGPSRRKLGILAAGAVVVVVVLAVLLGGLVPGLHPSSSPPSVATVSEQTAATTAAPLVGAISGGPWVVGIAEGMNSILGSSESASSTFGNASCPLHGGTVTDISFPGFNGTYSNGEATGWLLAYYSTAVAETLLFVFVTGGVAGEVGVLSGPGCNVDAVGAPLPAGLIDSTAAATAATSTAAGAAFVADYPRANATYVLDPKPGDGGAIGRPAPFWFVEFESPCSSDSELGVFTAEVFATNGTIETAETNLHSCGVSSSTPIASAFAVGNPIVGSCPSAGGGCLAAGDLVETLTIEESAVTFGSVLFEVTTASGAVWDCGSDGTGTGSGTSCGFSVVNATGAVVAASATVAAGDPVSMSGGFATYTGVTSASSLLAGLDSIVVDFSGAGSTGLGLDFVVVGQAAYSGTTPPLALP